METFSLLPEHFAGLNLIMTAYLVQAEQELNALGLAMLEEAQAGIAEGRHHWTWQGAQERHEASDDVARQEPWIDVLAGKWFKLAEQCWEKMSDDLDPSWLKLVRTSAAAGNGFEGLAEVVGEGVGSGDGLPSGLDLDDAVAAGCLDEFPD